MKITKIVLLAFLFVFVCGYASATEEKELNAYHKDAEVTCQDCHGEEKDPLPENSTCLECHGPQDELAAAVNRPENEYHLAVNPHYAFHYNDGMSCVGCHSEHNEARLFCNNCHQFDMKMPEKK